MNAETAIARIKKSTHDISDEYSTEECLTFLNTAIQQVASLLISARWPSLAKEIDIHEGETLPENYMGPCGTYPIRMTEGKAHILDGSEYVRFRYFATPKAIENETEDLPFNHDAINEVVVKAATILALNENEYDISQDNAILSALQQAISSGIS